MGVGKRSQSSKFYERLAFFQLVARPLVVPLALAPICRCFFAILSLGRSVGRSMRESQPRKELVSGGRDFCHHVLPQIKASHLHPHWPAGSPARSLFRTLLASSADWFGGGNDL